MKDGLAALAALEGDSLVGVAADAAALLALVVGQDVAEGDDGVFRIVRGAAKDRVISTVDPQARHGHKSRNRRFDSYKTHASIDPDSELVDEVVATPANKADRDAVEDLLAPSTADHDKPEVVGDSAYAGAETRDELGRAGHKVRAKVPPVRNRAGRLSKDRFAIDLDDNTVTCPAGQRVAIVALRRGRGRASFAPHCHSCPLRQRCTAARRGRSITIHPHEALLQAARAEQASPEWIERYRADRPIVERKMAHFARRLWGGPKARCRGLARISTDVDTRAQCSTSLAWRCSASPSSRATGCWRPVETGPGFPSCGERFRGTVLHSFAVSFTDLDTTTPVRALVQGVAAAPLASRLPPGPSLRR